MKIFLERQGIFISKITTHKYMNKDLQIKSVTQNYITQSMSKAGYPYNNAPMELYFNTLNRELINQHYYHNDQELNDDIYDYAYVWYNHLRPHTFNN